jgi:hypothetical protein
MYGRRQSPGNHPEGDQRESPGRKAAAQMKRAEYLQSLRDVSLAVSPQQIKEYTWKT